MQGKESFINIFPSISKGIFYKIIPFKFSSRKYLSKANISVILKCGCFDRAQYSPRESRQYRSASSSRKLCGIGLSSSKCDPDSSPKTGDHIKINGRFYFLTIPSKSDLSHKNRILPLRISAYFDIIGIIMEFLCEGWILYRSIYGCMCSLKNK